MVFSVVDKNQMKLTLTKDGFTSDYPEIKKMGFHVVF